jgi:DNA (cytosine-5)-methyltransferase 1
MLNGLDIFTGFGGISIALAPWVRPVLYCEVERYPQSVLLSRMADGDLPFAPIWDDVTTLNGRLWRGIVDIIYGGFPCQDISTAGAGAGLEGKRSGLFFEILRLADEVRPSFVFLENVPAIRTRGLERVIEEFSIRGYDCRWRMLSAAEVGAPHLRNRWFLLAADTHGRTFREQSLDRAVRHAAAIPSSDGKAQSLAHTDDQRLSRSWPVGKESKLDPIARHGRWTSESAVCRVDDGSAHRLDRFKALGNGVVPAQVREAFESLLGGCLDEKTVREVSSG